MAPATFRAVQPAMVTDYETAREYIKTGDIISFFSSHEESLFHRFATVPILWFTGSYIFHTGIAIWVTVADSQRLMLVEAVGSGRRFVNLSKFREHKMEVHHRPDYVNEQLVVDFMLDGLEEGYGFLNLIRIGAEEYFKGSAKQSEEEEKMRRVCSQVAADAWKFGGFDIEDTLLSPGKLRNVLIDKGVPPAIVINPDASPGFKNSIWNPS